ncbi:hypothetical protein [Thalassobacillus hwangdonensis]|uniref:Deacetylase PdaC domain-containing protein n=1 Tax=Thalassobacillus hwangdonensis TaxID=546108 RepID=A0ABW3L062_9BACI
MFNRHRLTLVILSVVILALSISIYQQNHVRTMTFYEQPTFDNTNQLETWQLFSEKMNVSMENSKIENFRSTLDKNLTILSLRFDLVEKVNNTFHVYYYSQCVSCENDQVSINRSTAKEWLQYDQMVYANSFFTSLDNLIEQKFLSNEAFNYQLIVSSGWRESRIMEGSYYLLKDEVIQEISNDTPQTVSGFHFQVIGNDQPTSFHTDEDTTKAVFIHDSHQ